MISISSVIHIIFNVLSFIVIADALVSFILPPYNAIRSFLDRLVYPFLNPIRRIIPPLGGLDLSPIVLLLIFQLVDYLLTRFIP